MTPEETEPRFACEYPGVSGRGVGWQHPPTGSGALSVPVCAQDLFKEITIVFIISTIVWSQVKQQGGNTAPHINRKLDYRFSMALPMLQNYTLQNYTQFPPKSVSPTRKLP